jgi:glycyl-tRNA synthetase beta chain
MNPTLLVEIFTEELPPKALQTLSNAFSELLSKTLRDEGHLVKESQIESFTSPRRLACRITHVLSLSPEKKIRERLLPVKIGLDINGQATPPLQKKLDSLGLSGLHVDQLEKINDGKQDVLFISRIQPSKTLETSLNKALEVATTELPIPKIMSYQRPDGQTVHFVRPAHRLVCLHGENVVPSQVLGLESNRFTLGHRFLSEGLIHIKSAESYESQLELEGKVIASFEKRKAKIVQALAEHAAGDHVVMPDDLIHEVCALVEWPAVYAARFEKEFLEVPQECLILTMQANQKYFAITDQNGKMRNRFLLVSNLFTPTPELIKTGNERVLRARLADAKFFFDQDRKKTLESRLSGLANVVYHNKLGTQKDRNGRLLKLAEILAPMCGADVELAQRATLLCKADLLTDMVGEFPELQGTMGEHYARHDGESDQVAQAIADHYNPRFAGDQLPRNPVGVTAALADKLETLVGIYSIGLIPTGDKDPFALRRHALGLIRMVIEKNLKLNLPDILNQASQLFEEFPDFKHSTKNIADFIQDRLRSYLKEQGYSTGEVESVLSQNPSQFADIPKRLEAVRAFSALPESQALAAANKRIYNILKKAEIESSTVNPNLFKENAEKALADQIAAIEPESTLAYKQGDYQQALLLLAPLKETVDAFFEHVMVMDNNEALKNNRLALLKYLHSLMNRVADISQLAS